MANAKIDDGSLRAPLDGTERVEITIGGAFQLRGTIDAVSVFTGTVDTFASLDTTSKTLVGAINEVRSSIISESIWNRDVALTFIFPQNAGDDLNMLQGSIYTIAPNNTSGTKSYEISQVLTGAVPSSENASMIFKGLKGGSLTTFMTYFGASNSITFKGEDWVFDNTVCTIAKFIKKVNLNTEGGSGFYFDQVFGRDSASAEVAYYQDRAIIGTNTAGSENGIHVFDVMDNGNLTKYLELNALTKQINFSAIQHNFKSVDAGFFAVDIITTSKQASDSGLVLTSTANGMNSTPATAAYSRDRIIIGSNAAGVEDGIHAFDVSESGSLIEYLELNGLTGHTNFRSLQYNFHSVTALDSVQIVAASQQDAAFGLILTLKADGLDDVGGAVTYSDTRTNIVSSAAAGETSTYTLSVMEGGALTQYISLSGNVQRVDINKDLLVTGDVTADNTGADGFINSLTSGDVENVRFDSSGDSWLLGGDFGAGTNTPSAKIDLTGDFRVTIPSGLFTYGAGYTTGSGLSSTPAAVAVELIEAVDVNEIWVVNSPATGEVTYSGITRYFQMQVNMTVATATGGASTITVKIQKQVGAGGWVDVPGGVVDRFLSASNDTGSFCLGCVISMSSADDLRLIISSSSDTPTYTFNYIDFQISAFT